MLARWSNIRAGLAAALAGVPGSVVGRSLNPSHFIFTREHHPATRPSLAVPSELPENSVARP